MQNKTADKLVLVTDALKYARAMPPADADFYFDKCFKRKADDVIIGSGITMLDGFRNLIEYGVQPEDAVRMASAQSGADYETKRQGNDCSRLCGGLKHYGQELQLVDTMIGGKFVREKKHESDYQKRL